MEKSSKKKYYYHNNNNKKYYPKKKKKKEELIIDKITYDKLVNTPSDGGEIIDYPKETDDSMIKFVAISITIMAIIFGSLLLFRLI